MCFFFFLYNTDLHFTNKHPHKYNLKDENLHDTGSNTETSHSTLAFRCCIHIYVQSLKSDSYIIVKGIRSLNILCYIKGQKREPMNCAEVFKNLIVDFIIFLLLLKLRFSDPYRRIFKSFSWDNFFKVGFKAQISLRSSVLRSE